MSFATGSSNEGDEKKQLILYADDDMDDLELVEEAFQKYADEVTLLTFRDGGQVLNYAENEASPLPCLVILDINMPVIDGKKVLARLRALPQYKYVPVVLFTTSTMLLDETFADKYNAAFITKPLNAEQMANISDRFLDHCSDEVKVRLGRTT